MLMHNTLCLPRRYVLVIQKLEVNHNDISQLFNENAMKANGDKCHFLIVTNEERNISIGGEKIRNN